MTEKEVQILFNECKQIMIDCNIPISNSIDPIIHINKRYKKLMGCCTRVNGKYKFRISISSHILDSDEIVLKKIILHEYIHTVKGCLNHGTYFKNYCKILNDKFGYDIHRLVDSKTLKFDNTYYTYRLKCPNCSISYLRKRKPYSDRIYKCGNCGHKLIVEKIQ